MAWEYITRGNRRRLLKALDLSEADLSDIGGGNEVLSGWSSRPAEAVNLMADFLECVMARQQRWGVDVCESEQS